MSITAAYKITLVVVFMLVIFALGQAMYFMLADRKKRGSRRMVWALTLRVALSALLIVLIVIGIQSGILQPHNVPVGQGLGQVPCVHPHVTGCRRTGTG